jgi:uncharacterized membrane protein YvlD (DUF360 family)
VFQSGDLVRLLVSWVVSTLALALTDALLPGFTASSWVPLAAAAAATGLVGLVVRPVLVRVVATIGWIAVLLGALVGQAVVMMLALTFVPGIHFESFWTVVAAAWIAAVFGTLLSWLGSAGTEELFAASLLRTRPGTVADPQVDGMVFVQLDGVSFPVVQWALRSGSMPTMRRWLDSGTHALQEWTVQLPCTTPASQQAILHGSAAGVPAFRWYDRALGRVLVANRPEDAAIIETRVTTGRGLLADDGVSVSNLFTGDAARASMTMSRMEVARGSRRSREVFARFLLRPDGLARSVTRTFAEVGRERFQAIRQNRLQIHPRVHRSWTFAGLRAFSNGLLRDLNLAVVADEMMRGAHSIYVDFVDYDEVAHHAGGTRVEALSVLTGLDQVLSILERLAAQAPRRYRLVVLSDHGQSQGEPFAARYGTDLAALCAQLTSTETTGVEDSVEGWGRMDSVLEDLAGDHAGSGNVPQAFSRRVDDRIQPQAATPGTELIVLGSGNLGLVYVPGPERIGLEELERRWPALVPGIAGHPGVGFVAALAADGPVAIGRYGRHHLATGIVEGKDPLEPYGPHAAGMLQAATCMAEAPELYVNSAVDPENLEVAAFEPLVGCHGGLGGWQDRAFVLAPPDLMAPDGPIVGGEQLHRRLVDMLDKLGHRSDLAASEP